MELVPIIYNSLLVVFTLLALVVGGSLLCSKLLFCGQDENKRGKVKQNIVKTNTLPRSTQIPRSTQTVQREILKRKEVAIRKSQPKIERRLIDNKKIKIVSRAERRKKENAQSFASNNASRYSVVNANIHERSSRNELFYKFSKMSIEYSQSA